MCRARSPVDSTDGIRALPKTKLAIGMKVDPKQLLKPWVRGQILRRALRRLRAIISRIRRHHGPTFGGGPGPRLHQYNKDQIRQMMFVVDNAYAAEVCGVIAHSQHVKGSVSNQCYISDGQSHSGVDFYAEILFRARLNDDRGNHVAFIPEDCTYLFPECAVLKAKLARSRRRS